MFENVKAKKPEKQEVKKEELEKRNIGNYQQGFHERREGVSREYLEEYERRKRRMIYFIIFLAFFFILVFGSSVWLVKFLSKGKAQSGYELQIPDNISTSTSLLPQGQNVDPRGNDSAMGDLNLKAEDIIFGNYYKNLTDDFEISFSNYTLPIDSKVNIDNFYEVSRRISLDKHVEQLNKYGYAIIGAENGKEHNFFSASRGVVEKNIPLLITDDFIIYYYQNKLKDFFKEIEKNVFYDNIWDIYKRMYDTALKRYEAKVSDFGVSSDSLLEGSRLELSYLAVLLSLLQPQADQIEQKPGLKNDAKFSQADADGYGFNLPEFLKADVLKELELIRSAKITARSPVLLYARDYTEFAVPSEYKSSAKLHNFYKVLKWLNSQFPLYYKNDDCPDCLLDENDWKISMAAAGYLSEDLSRNQELKNLWAIIYKFISYFSGLRHELTYLHYNDVYESLFGSGYAIDDIYPPEDPQRHDKFISVQGEIAKKQFLDLEGGYKRINENKKYIGMRLLQENYWPNDYIFGKLTGPDLIYSDSKPDKSKNITQCPIKGAKGPARCGGIGLDIVNLLYPVKENEHFNNNTLYTNYGIKTAELKSELGKFDLNTWNNNNYWATLDAGKRVLYYPADNYAAFMKDEKWRQEIGVNTFMGAWTNLHIERDILQTHYNEYGSFGHQGGCSKYNYVTPNSKLINELLAKTRMLMQMSEKLGLNRKDKVASSELADLERLLSEFKNIIKKELQGVQISDMECNTLLDFSNFNTPASAVDKKFLIGGNYSNLQKIPQSINGYKLLAVVYKAPDGKIIMAVGPIFNYQEKNTNIR
jgi:hypothetical protein